MIGPEASVPLEVNSNTPELVEVSPEVRAEAEIAITTVWRQHMTEPTSVNLAFQDNIDIWLPNREYVQVNASYNPITNTIAIAVGTLQQHYPNYSLKDLVLVHAAHEARHKVQVARGHMPPNINIGYMEIERYQHNPYEVEAWQSSIDAFSAMYPGTPIEFTTGSRTYSNRRSF